MQILSLLYISYCRPNREHPKTWNLLRMSVKAMHKYYGRICEGDGILIPYFLPQNAWFLFLKVLDTVCLSWFLQIKEPYVRQSGYSCMKTCIIWIIDYISDGDVNKLPDKMCEKPSLILRLLRWVCGIETEPEKEQRLARDAQDRLDQVGERHLPQCNIDFDRIALVLIKFSPSYL